MNDTDGPLISRSIYTELLKTDRYDIQRVPYALDAAVRELRNQGAPPSRWGTFIHIGA